MIREPLVVALNAGAYVAVTLTGGARKDLDGTPISYYTSDGTAFYIATVQVPGNDNIVIPANTTMNVDTVRPDANGVIFYAKSSAGTPNLIVHVGEKDKANRR